MEYLYRALNPMDMELEPLKNGLVNKKVISQNIERAYALCFFHTKGIEEILGGYENVTRELYSSIYENVKFSFVKEIFPSLLYEIEQTQTHINSIIDGLKQEEEEKILMSYSAFLEIASTLQTHLCHGSKVDTFWISFSKDLESIQKYYLGQKKHAVAIIQGETNSIFDFSHSSPSIVYDLSSCEKVDQNLLLINKPEEVYSNFFKIPQQYTITSKRARGLNYAIASKEVLYYYQVPKEKMVALLNPLEIDLLLNGVLDLNLYAESKSYVNLLYKKLLHDLKKGLQASSEYDAKVEYVFENHFKEQKSIDSISTSLREREEFLHVKKKVLAHALSLNSRFIQGPSPNQIRIMERI